MTSCPEKAYSRSESRWRGALIERVLYGWAAFILALGILAYLQSPGFSWQIKAITSASIVFFIAIARYMQSRKTTSVLNWNKAGIAVLFAVTVATFWWAWRFDTVQNSDFGVYFRCGAQAGLPIAKWIDACQSAYLHQNLIYWNRSLLYTVPLESMTGSNYFALKLYNATLHSVAIAFWFFGLRHYYGARIATVACALLAFYPEWWFTTTLATTDNAAMLFIIGFLLLLPKLDTGTRKSLVVLGLAVTLFAANLLRTVGPILIISLVLWITARQANRWNPRAIAHILAIVLLYALMNWLLKSITPAGSSDPLQLLKTLSTVDFTTTQDFSVNYPWNEYFWFAIPDEWRAQVALHKIAAEILNELSRWPLYLYQKASVLFSGSGYYNFSSFPDYGANPDTVLNVPVSTVPLWPSILPWLSSAVFLLLVVAGWTTLAARLDGPALVSVIWIGAFALIVLGITEAQSRYSVLIAPALSLLAALAFSSHAQSTKDKPSRQIWGLFTATGFIVIAVAFGTLIAGLHLFKSAQPNPLLLATQSQSREAVAVQCAAQPVPAKIEASYKHLRVINPPGSNCLTITVPLSESVKAVAFFASGSKFPYLWEPVAQSPYRYIVELNNQVILEASLEDKTVRWHRIALAEGDAKKAGQLQLTVIRTDASKEDFIDFSLYTEMK